MSAELGGEQCDELRMLAISFSIEQKTQWSRDLK